MKNRTIDLTLLFIVCLLLAGYFWTKNLIWDSDAYFHDFDRVEDYARNGDWGSALSLSKEMKAKWHQDNFIILVNYSEAEFSLFEETLNHIVAGSEAEDLAEVLSYTQNAQDLWRNFNRFVPEP
ncbi:hypothetical protein ACOJQI_12310 [Bacillus salacetis]|uniref:hypothetical protein n=1 Tax=Bacillus salacetis TaxID=2315464 RepID=UPI003BA27150